MQCNDAGRTGRGVSSRAFWLALLLAAPLYIFGTFNHDVWRPADAREAAIAREMIENGNWVATYLNGNLFLEKPPLYTWLLAGPMLVFGYREWAFRIFVLLFTLATLAAAYRLARCILPRRGAQGALLALATMWLFLEVNHGAMVDNGLVFLVTLAMLAFFAGTETSPPSFGYALIFYTAVGLTFLCKGAVGVVLIGGALFGYLSLTRRWGRFWRFYPLVGALIVCGLAGAWLLALWRRGGTDYFYVFFVENHLQRFMGTYEPTKVRWYYIPYLPLIALPWTLVIPAGVRILWRRGRGEPLVRRMLYFCFCWIGAMFAILSVAGSKGHQYLMPVLPPMAVFAGAWVEHTMSNSSLARWEKWLTRLFIALVSLGGVVFALLPLWLAPTGRVVGVLLAVLMAAAAACAWRAMFRDNWRNAWRALAALAVVGALVLGWSVEGIMDRHKTMRPLARLLDEHIEPEAGLWGFDLNENTQGALIFYGHRPVLLPDLEGVDRFIRPGPAYILLVSGNRRDELEHHLSESPGWQPVFFERIGGRYCRLYRRDQERGFDG